VVGSTIGNYQVVSLLGEGGMGKVYLAHHPGIGRRSAIKVLHANLAGDPAAVSRFFTEARASNAIRHPNIVEIFDSGTLDSGAPYIIMEHLEGETLGARMARGLALGPALDFACQAASALAAAHSQQVVHRDLKPENLFITTDPRDSRVPPRQLIKVLDFGVAKLQERLEEPAHRTRSGSLVGTPRYMSPEQCLGEGRIDERSDIYSLGVIVYEMVCGRPPFVTEAVGAVINMHINRPPDPPRQVNPAISAPLEATILRSLAKNPDDRYPKMLDFLYELRAASATLGAASDSVPPRTADNTAAPPTPTPLSAMATLMDVRSPTLPSTPPPATRSSPGAAAPTTPRWRPWIFAVIGMVELTAAVVLFVLLRPERESPPGSHPNGANAVAPSVRPPAPPPGSTRPASDSVELLSVPSGAAVSIGGRSLGVTPLHWTPAAPTQVTAFTFDLDGHRREVIYAFPSPGLKLTARLRRLAGKRPAATRADGSAIPDDIKSER
jgi:serine/threonine protein kinase